MLKPVEEINPTVDPEILADAEQFLADVKAGKVSSYALCWRQPDGTNSSVYKSNRYGYGLVGLLHALQRRILDYLESD